MNQKQKTVIPKECEKGQLHVLINKTVFTKVNEIFQLRQTR